MGKTKRNITVELNGAWFYKGAFWIDIKEIDGEPVAQGMLSNNADAVEIIHGKFDSIDDLLSSEQGKRAKKLIDEGDFDFIMIGHGAKVSFYLNHRSGLKLCEAKLISNE